MARTKAPPATRRARSGARPTRSRRGNASSGRWPWRRRAARRDATRRLPDRSRPTGGRGGGAQRGAVPAESRPGHGRDVRGVLLLVVAVLAALSLWSANPAGVLNLGMVLLFRGLFGVLGLLAPLLLAAVGVALLRGPRPEHPRIGAGAAAVLLGAAGLVSLWRGTPGLRADTSALHQAAGWVGECLTTPLTALVGVWGSVVVLLGVIVAGLCVATATPPRVVAERVAGAVRRLRDAVAERRQRSALRRGEPAADAVVDEADEPAEQSGDGDEPQTAISFDGVADDETLRVDDPELTDTQLLPRGLDPSPAPGADEDTQPNGLARRTGPPRPQWEGYELPSLSLLRGGRIAPGNRKALEQMTRALEHTLTQFGVDAKVTRVSRGPTVTRFELSLAPGVKVSSVTKLNDDISYALATAEIRIVAPIPGKSAIGIEVPNRDRDLITLGDVLRSPEAQTQRHPLTAGIGVDIAGNPVLVNLATMPHLLIAGATGSGKSVTMNAIVTSVLMRATPAEVRMILVDPKRVELNTYDGAPHLLTPVVTDPKRAKEALDWTVKEMSDRYERLSLLGYRNLDSYNAAVRSGSVRSVPALSGQADTEWEELPYILFVIDELADLMMVAPRDVEGGIVRIAQMARAVGIHLVVATQRPSVDVVTGLIKANIPSRVALAMATGHDSKTILDQYGAEKLVGHGDMLFVPANASKPHRVQGCYVDETEVEQVVAFCTRQRTADYASGVVREGAEASMADLTGDDASDEDLTRAAMELVVRSGLGSTSMLQRKLKVGFARAGRLMDELEQMGVVGPSEGPKARRVLLTVEELERRSDGT